MARAAGGGERAVNPCVAREYIESCLKIRTKSGAVVPFRLNAAQQKLYAVAKRQQDEGKPVRIIILKARQLGFSTLTEALLFHACATRANVNALVVAHREDATANLFRMSKLFYDELPAPVKPMLRTSNAQELVFENPSRASRGALPGLRSRFRCATAGGRGIGRSDTLQCVHISEYAFWPEGSESKAATLAGILQAVPSRPGTMVIIESTANGCEDFKDRWDAAVAGENDFEPVFFAWFENPDYAMPVEPGIEWTAEERETRERYSLSWEQLRWRRWCIANNCGGSRDMFRQEYPANPDEAFLYSGSGVFDNALVIRRREEAAPPVRRGRFVPGNKDGESVWQDDDAGEICIYRECEPGHPYVLGGDTAGDGSDWFTAHAIDNSTGEQAACLRRRFSEPEYVRQVYALGRHYNDALVALSASDAPAFEAFIKEFDATLKNEYAVTDGGISLVCEKADVPAAFSAADTSRLLHVLLALPQGVQEMSADFPGLVQTSLNLGVMRTGEHGVKCSFSVRSCIASQKDMLIQRVKAIVEFGGGTVGERSNYPGWQYDRDSALRKEVEEVYRDLTGHDGKIEATHGGLECGLFIEKIPGLDALSMGPELHDVHSVNERLNVASTERVYKLVCEVLRRSK